MDFERLAAIPSHELAASLSTLSEFDLIKLQWQLTWWKMARDKQLPPDDEWLIWYIMSGRGFGKTLTAANWFGMQAANDPESINFVIAPTDSDVVGTCFEGPTGLLSVIPQELIADYVSTGKMGTVLTLYNGAIFRGFSAQKPNRLRGPQCHRAWCEEVSSWEYDTETWDMMMFGLRLGNDPRVIATSTPKPRPLVKMLTKHPKCHLTVGSTYENKANLPQTFLDEIVKYEGTRLGRQEIHGEVIDPEELGIIKRSWIKLWPLHERELPEFIYLIMSLDTAFTEKTVDKETYDPDFTACGIWGVFYEKTLESSRGVVTRRKGLPSVMLIDAWQDRLGMPDLVARVKDELKHRYGKASKPLVSSPWGPQLLGDDGRKVDMIIIEDKGSGISLRQMLEQDGIIAHPFNPGKADKLARLHEVSPLFARGRVWTIESKRNPGHARGWAEPVIEQLCTYAGEDSLAHDDHVDQTTQALRVLVYTRQLRAISEQQAVEELEREVESRITGVPPEHQGNSNYVPEQPERNPYLRIG